MCVLGLETLPPADLFAHGVPFGAATELAAALGVGAARLSVVAARLFTLDVYDCLLTVELIHIARHGRVRGRREGRIQKRRDVVVRVQLGLVSLGQNLNSKEVT